MAKPKPPPDAATRPRAVIIGAGIAGLCSTARLLAAGYDVTVIERAGHVGGKIRATPSTAGPVDAGPTVLTMKHVFEDVFATLGAKLADHVTLSPCPVLARHFWPDGSQLDLTGDMEKDSAAIAVFAGKDEATRFARFHHETAQLFDSFRDPMMEEAEPNQAQLAGTVLRNPALLPAMAPWRSLAKRLRHRFTDPRLAQLFGRYATYVGGSPYASPALLGLIWQAESRGVWQVEGGIAKLPQALAALCTAHGATFLLNSEVSTINTQNGRAVSVSVKGLRDLPADVVVFNGDPRALATRVLGPDVAHIATVTKAKPRSLSALVWSFAARVSGPDLHHHNVFFSNDDQAEFRALAKGQLPDNPTLYLCAQDRGHGTNPTGPERFEIIINAPPLTSDTHPQPWDFETCQMLTFRTLARFNVTVDPLPEPDCLSQPTDFAERFPASLGSLYGQSPHGLTASLARPRAKTPIKGLYLAGGGTHPGAGMPMAALSARHAVEMILSDQTSPSTARPMAMPGGISTGSATTARAPFRS